MTILEKISIFNKSYDSGIDISKQHDDRISNLKVAIKTYKQLPNVEKVTLEFKLYLSYRTLGSLYFETNRNSKEAIINFERSLEIVQHGDFDSPINICVTKQMLSKSYLLQALKTNNNLYINKAESLLTEIEQNILSYGNPDYISKVSEVKSILQHIKESNLNTIVTFEVPYHIVFKNNYTINVVNNSLNCSISSETILSGCSGFIQQDDGQFIYNKKDKYGLINHSRVTVSIPKYIDPEKTVKVNNDIGEIWCPLVEAIDVLNNFVRVYKDATSYYWLDNINELMIFNYSVIVKAGDIAIRTVPLNIPLGITTCGIPLELSNDVLAKLQERLNKNESYLWISSYQDALNQFQIKNYKEAIILTNIALESFIYLFARNLLVNYMKPIEVENFLIGEIDYNDFFLKEYISKEIFEDIKKKGVIKNNPPSIYKIIKFCTQYANLNCSTRKLNSLISDIKKLRNDIVHGKEINISMKSQAQKCIDSFFELKNILLSNIE